MKYAVVTGGTKGIGKAISIKLLQKGYFVIVNYASDTNAAKQFENENFQYKEKFVLYQQEISSYESAEKFAKYIMTMTDYVSVLVLNAGVTNRTSLYQITRESWEYVMNTNVNAPFYLIQRLGERMVDNEGRIIFIGSVCGQFPHSVSIPYGVSKAAVHQMSKELVKFFSPRGITVNTIVPGFIDTPWQKNKSEEQRERIAKKTALRRFGMPEEVASLCCEIINNPYINGANLNIDGGYCFE